MEEYILTAILKCTITSIATLTFFFLFILFPKRTQTAKQSVEKPVQKEISYTSKSAAVPISRVIFICVIVIFVICLTEKNFFRNTIPVSFVQFFSIFLALFVIGGSAIKRFITSIKSPQLDEKDHYIIFCFALLYLVFASQINAEVVNTLLSDTTLSAFVCVLRLVLFSSSSFFLLVAMLLILLSRIVHIARSGNLLKNFEKSLYSWTKTQTGALRHPEFYYNLQKKENGCDSTSCLSSALKFIGIDLLNVICFLCRIFFTAFSFLFLFVVLIVLSFFDSIVKALKNLPIRETVVLSLRLAVVFGVTSVVVFLHIYYSFEKTKALISAVEFVASTILIPVLFEWIQSILKEREKNKSSTEINGTREENNTTSNTSSPS